MKYINSIENIDRVIETPLKKKFKVPLRLFEKRKIRINILLLYSCLLDSAVPVKRPYLYTSSAAIHETFRINKKNITKWLKTMERNGLLYFEYMDRNITKRRYHHSHNVFRVVPLWLSEENDEYIMYDLNNITAPSLSSEVVYLTLQILSKEINTNKIPTNIIKKFFYNKDYFTRNKYTKPLKDAGIIKHYRLGCNYIMELLK